MALSMILGQHELTAKEIDTKAEVKLEEVKGGFAITAVHLRLKAKIPGASQEQFEQATEAAKTGCPVSKLLKAEVTLDSELVD